ncbi:MAG TPA: hypothetical protein VGP80_10230 [Gemmatimonadales bacterium]|jgi:hypothetical protein|nr:hypothetical protein [Gemmatimonadales bacterium]
MHRGRIEELKRAEKEAAERVHAAAKVDPYDPARYHRALVEWKSARLALRSLGVAVPKMVPSSDPTERPRKTKKKG